jgi:hypothetical protein
VRIAFHHTHAYPGCRATVRDDPVSSGGPAEAEFSDGPVVAATFARLEAGELLVRIAAYRTARGTRIPAKGWILRHVAGDGWKVITRGRRGLTDEPALFNQLVPELIG